MAGRGEGGGVMREAPMVYLAGPIDQARGHGDLKVMRTRARDELSDAGCSVYDPSKPFGGGWLSPEAVVEINTAALQACHGMLALMPLGIPTVGTPMEIQQNVDAGRPVVVVSDAASVQLQGEGVEVFAEGQEAQAVRRLRQLINDSIASSDAMIGRIRGVRESWEAWGASEGREVVQVIKWTGAAREEPRRGHPGDAGFDLYVSETTEVPPGAFVDVPCGVSMELPHGVWGLITGRSSTLRDRQLMVTQGVIDQGYRGPLFAGVWNLSPETRYAEAGARLAQIIPFPVLADSLELLHVQGLAPHPRGEAGFGSTGV